MSPRMWNLSRQSLWTRFIRDVFSRASWSGRRGKHRRPVLLRTFQPRVEILEDRLAPATLTWTGLGATNNWSDAANWSTSKAPTSGDSVVFDGTSGKNATVDAAFTGTVSNVTINSGYTGAVTMNRNLHLLGAFSQNAGTFAEQTNALTVAGNFATTGGNFDAGNGTLLFNSNAGNLTHSITVNGSLTLNNLTFGDSGSGSKTYTLGSGQTLNVQGNFTMQRSGGTTTMRSNGGTIAVQGNVIVGAGASGGSTDVQMDNTSQGQTYTASGGGSLPTVEIIDGPQTVSAAAGTSSLAVQNLLLTSGTLAAPTGNLTIAGNLTQTGGAFNPDGGTLLFATNYGNHAININSAAAGLLGVNNLTLADGGAGSHIYTFGAGDGFYLSGNFTAQVQAGSTAAMLVNGGIFEVTGTISKGTGYRAGTPAPRFTTVAPGTGAISGAVYDDESGSGQQQGNDPGLLAWTVNLLDSNSNVIATQTTSSAGGYSFLNLTPGTYRVKEVPPSGYTPTTATSLPISVSAGNNVVANFGNFQNITISGTVFDDANGDGQQQLSELGIPNTTVQLYTVTNGQVSANPLQTTTTDASGNYSFANLGPLAQGEAYVVAQVAPGGTGQTKPVSGSTIPLPDGRIGWLVPATGGVEVNLTGKPDPNLSGTGTYTLNKLNNSTSATVKFNDGAGHSGSVNAKLSQFNVTFKNGVNPAVTFNTFCIDLLNRISGGTAYAAAVQPSLALAYVNAGPMGYIFQNFGESDLSGNATQAAAVQVAEWDLTLNNHNPTQFVKDADGTYSSGDENVFSVNFGTNPNGAAIAALVNQYLQESQGATNSGAWLDTQNMPLVRGQSLLLPQNFQSFGDQLQATPQIRTSDPQTGDPLLQTGNVQYTVPLNLTQSPPDT